MGKWLGRARAVARSYAIGFRQRRRGRTFARLSRATAYAAVDTGACVFIVSTHDTGIGRSLYAKRTRPEMSVLPRAVDLAAAAGALRRRRTFVEVGANIGTTTMTALALSFDRAVACEADTRTARLLRANLALNGVEAAVTVVERAISAQPGTVPFDDRRSDTGKHRVPKRPGPHTREIPATSLDALEAEEVFSVDEVDFLWIDVEGHETQVLEGARRLLARGTPLVLELHPRRLERLGTLETLKARLIGSYTHAVDLSGTAGALEPISELGSIIDRYAAGGATDVLVCRLR